VTDGIESLDAEIRAYEIRALAGELPVVEGDGVLLGVADNNLLLNALRYGPRNGGDVRIRARRERAQWRISVTSQ
jgi:signal transduction histidine kinase